MSVVHRCDVCGELIDGRPFEMDEYAPGDGNAWALLVTVNRIDARGPQRAHLHPSCWQSLVSAMSRSVDG